MGRCYPSITLRAWGFRTTRPRDGYAQADTSFNYLLCDGHVNPCRWAGASIIIRVVLRWLPTCHSITTRRPNKTRDPGGGPRGGTYS